MKRVGEGKERLDVNVGRSAGVLSVWCVLILQAGMVVIASSPAAVCLTMMC
jgi:hypothetical protein